MTIFVSYTFHAFHISANDFNFPKKLPYVDWLKWYFDESGKNYPFKTLDKHFLNSSGIGGFNYLPINLITNIDHFHCVSLPDNKVKRKDRNN